METEKNIFDELVGMILNYYPELKGKPLTMDTAISGQAGVDSLGFIFVVAKLENRYNIKISNHQVKKLVTLGDVVRLVESKTKHHHD